MLKKPWICPACRSIVSTRDAPAVVDQVGHQLGADRHARRDLAILAGVPVVRHHRRDPARRRALQRVEHQQELHQVVVAGGRRRLDDETSPPRTFSLISTLISPSLKRPTSTLARRHRRGSAQMSAAAPDSSSGEDLDVVFARRQIRPCSASTSRSTAVASWAGRIRTFDAGSKVRCLTAWRPPITASPAPIGCPTERVAFPLASSSGSRPETDGS